LQYAQVQGKLVSQAATPSGTMTVRQFGTFTLDAYSGLQYSPGFPGPGAY
jgi:hypothetical protein